jgi:hypothetical protein
MTHSKPASLANFKKGKPIVSVDNCAATLNWLVSCWSALVSPKKSAVKVEGVERGEPKLSLDVEGGAGVAVEDKSDGTQRLGLSVEVVGTDGSTTATLKSGKITFKSATDSNVVITPEADDDGNLTLTVGVYYA